MTANDLKQAKLKYQKLQMINDDIKKLHTKFLELEKQKEISEYLNLINCNTNQAQNRILELKQNYQVKKYLYLLEKYNGFEPLDDNYLIDKAFSHLEHKENTCNIYQYISSYTIKEESSAQKYYSMTYPQINVFQSTINPTSYHIEIYKNLDKTNRADYIAFLLLEKVAKREYKLCKTNKNKNIHFQLYKNIETKENIMVSIRDILEFESQNKIINFHNKHHENFDLYYSYRTIYLRQHLQDNLSINNIKSIEKTKKTTTS